MVLGPINSVSKDLHGDTTMLFTLHWRTHPMFRRVIIVAIAIMALLTLGIGAKAWLDSDPRPYSLGVQNKSGERVEAEVITLTPTGFEPREISRPSGAFLLAVSNRSSLQEVVLRLDRIGGNRMQELQLSRKRQGWKGVVNLPAGQYVLSEAGNPDWVCQITIIAE